LDFVSAKTKYHIGGQLSSTTQVSQILRYQYLATAWLHLYFQKGSHKKFRKGERTVIVPDPMKEIPLGTFASILRQSGLSKEHFI